MSKRDKEKYDSKDDSHSDDSRSRSTSRNNRNKAKNNSRSPDKPDHDALSIYIGNVDYSATEEELRSTFISCGEIIRVTIIKNMKTGHPKGAAFIEFADKDGVNAALDLNGKQVKGRSLIVTSKKPRPEVRDRDTRSYYDRRLPPRSAPVYSVYPSSRQPYGASVPRGAYYDPRDYGYDRRAPSHVQMQMDQAHMQPRYDPYRRPEFYDPYMMMPRGMQHPQYYSDPRKMNDFRGDPRGYRDYPRDYRDDPRGDSRNDPRGDSRNDLRSDSRNDPRGDSRNDPRGDPRGDSRNDHRSDHRGDHKNDLRNDSRNGHNRHGDQPPVRYSNPYNRR